MGEVDTDTMTLEEVASVLMRSADDDSLAEEVRRGELLAAITLKIVRRKFPDWTPLDIVNRAADMVIDLVDETRHISLDHLREIAKMDETRISDAFTVACHQ
jgi:hypothetical protein